jgi:opacity protein-like surface antigen
VRAALAAMVVLCLAAPASAQEDRRFDLSGGYSRGLFIDFDVDQEFHGWLVSAAGNVRPWLGIVGELGGNYETIPFGTVDLDLSLHSFMAGARFRVLSNRRVTPFAQLLAGGVRSTISALGQSRTETRFALQPGGGVDLWFTRNAGGRVGADYRRLFGNVDDPNGIRFHVGIVLGR